MSINVIVLMTYLNINWSQTPIHSEWRVPLFVSRHFGMTEAVNQLLFHPTHVMHIIILYSKFRPTFLGDFFVQLCWFLRRQNQWILNHGVIRIWCSILDYNSVACHFLYVFFFLQLWYVLTGLGTILWCSFPFKSADTC